MKAAGDDNLVVESVDTDAPTASSWIFFLLADIRTYTVVRADTA